MPRLNKALGCLFYGGAFLSGFLNVVGGKQGKGRRREKGPEEEKKIGYKEVGARGREDAKESSQDIMLVSPLGLSLYYLFICCSLES